MSDLFASAALSVSELNRLAKNLLEDNLAGLWIAGEVSNPDPRRQRALLFFAERQPRPSALRDV